MNNINKSEPIEGYIGLSVQKETSEILSIISKKVSKVLGDNSINFQARLGNFHATITYFKGTLDDFNLLKEDINNKLKVIKKSLKGVNGINSNIKYDETFHKIHLIKSNINNRVYLCLIPHNSNTNFKLLGKKGEVHISLGFFDEKLNNLNIYELEEIIKKIRDEFLEKGVQFGLDWSKLYYKLKTKKALT